MALIYVFGAPIPVVESVEQVMVAIRDPHARDDRGFIELTRRNELIPDEPEQPIFVQHDSIVAVATASFDLETTSNKETT